jgi:hypothetical protein
LQSNKLDIWKFVAFGHGSGFAHGKLESHVKQEDGKIGARREAREARDQGIPEIRPRHSVHIPYSFTEYGILHGKWI